MQGLTFKVSGQCQGKSHTVQVQLVIRSLPCCDQDNCLCRITPRCMDDTIDVLSLVPNSRRGVFVFLCSNFQSGSLQNRGDLIGDPIPL